MNDIGLNDPADILPINPFFCFRHYALLLLRTDHMPTFFAGAAKQMPLAIEI
jgi:hypothetical protein